MHISTYLSGLDVIVTFTGSNRTHEVRVLSADPLGLYAVEDNVRVFYPWSNIVMVEVDQ